MSEIWYEARFHKISEVEIERYTADSVWIKGRRQKRISWKSCFPTWDEAHAYLLEQADREVQGCQFQLNVAKDHRGNIVGMKRPSPLRGTGQ